MKLFNTHTEGVLLRFDSIVQFLQFSGLQKAGGNKKLKTETVGFYFACNILLLLFVLLQTLNRRTISYPIMSILCAMEDIEDTSAATRLAVAAPSDRST